MRQFFFFVILTPSAIGGDVAWLQALFLCVLVSVWWAGCGWLWLAGGLAVAGCGWLAGAGAGAGWLVGKEFDFDVCMYVCM